MPQGENFLQAVSSKNDFEKYILKKDICMQQGKNLKQTFAG